MSTAGEATQYQPLPKGKEPDPTPQRELQAVELQAVPATHAPGRLLPIQREDRLRGEDGHSNPVLYNRIGAVLEHIPWYGFRTQVRLAQDSGVSEAAISRLLRGESQPSLVVALQVTQAIEKRLGRSLDVRELFSLDGTFPTTFPCQLAACRNCLPQAFYDERDRLRRECRHIRPGQWSLVQAHHHTPRRPLAWPRLALWGKEAA